MSQSNTPQKRTIDYPTFYLYYLTQHLDPRCRAFHLVGTALLLVSFAVFWYTVAIGQPVWWYLAAIPFIGYGFAWTGHFLFEKNKPAAWSNPLWSLASDFVMFWHALSGQLSGKLQKARAMQFEA